MAAYRPFYFSRSTLIARIDKYALLVGSRNKFSSISVGRNNEMSRAGLNKFVPESCLSVSGRDIYGSLMNKNESYTGVFCIKLIVTNKKVLLYTILGFLKRLTTINFTILHQKVMMMVTDMLSEYILEINFK